MKGFYQSLIDSAELNQTSKDIIKQTWLGYLLLMDKKAQFNLLAFNTVQVLIIIIGILIPVLEAVSWARTQKPPLEISVIGLLGLSVAILTALNRHYRFEEKWRHYRKNAELMRSEGDDFFALSGQYKKFTTHQAPFKHSFPILLHSKDRK